MCSDTSSLSLAKCTTIPSNQTSLLEVQAWLFLSTSRARTIKGSLALAKSLRTNPSISPMPVLIYLFFQPDTLPLIPGAGTKSSLPAPGSLTPPNLFCSDSRFHGETRIVIHILHSSLGRFPIALTKLQHKNF